MKIYDIIKWDDGTKESNDIVAYKHEAEDFNTHSQLIVHASQEAVFFKDGIALDPFPAGTHSLKSKNLPLLSKIINIPTGGETPFHCEVYFINKIFMTDLLWGTPDPIQFRLMVDGVPIFLHLRANGMFGAHIEHASKFLTKVVGTRDRFTKAELTTYLKGKLLERVGNLLGETINKSGADIFNLASYYTQLSDEIKKQMIPFFNEFGIALDNFSFNIINIPEEDLKDLKAAQSMDVESAALARKRAREGYTYQMERGMDVMQTAAANEGMSGTFMGAGMGLGMGAGMGTTFGVGMANVAQNAFGNQPMQQGMAQQPVQQPQAQQGGVTCPDCGAQLPAGAKFCGNCGKKLGNFCPDCGAELMAGAKFCGNCGKKLVSACPGCGAELPAGAKFCGNCGQKV